jgi:hypothetical protein
MPLIEAKDRPHLACKRCGTVLVLPESLDVAARREAARLRQSDQPMAAIDYLRGEHYLDLREAKAVMMHIPQTAGVCHRCRGPVVAGDSVCPKCHCVSLNWI